MADVDLAENNHGGLTFIPPLVTCAQFYETIIKVYLSN